MLQILVSSAICVILVVVSVLVLVQGEVVHARYCGGSVADTNGSRGSSVQ